MVDVCDSGIYPAPETVFASQEVCPPHGLPIGMGGGGERRAVMPC